MPVSHIMGMHWLRYHSAATDWQHIAAMQYTSVKSFEWCWNNAGYAAELMVAAPNTLHVARDYPLSEQKEGLATDPTGLGRYHADEWAGKVQRGDYKLPIAQSIFLPINEPPCWQYLDGTVKYTVAYLRRMHEHGLRSGVLNLSVGWPGTSPDSNGQPDWRPYAPIEAEMRAGDVLVMHEYGVANDHGWGYWCNRIEHCPWQVPILIGECGIDQAVAGGPHKGWQDFLSPDGYVDWLDAYHAVMSADKRVISLEPFTYDFSHPWGSFDVRPAAAAMERKRWTTGAPTPPPIAILQPPDILPTPIDGVWPVPGGTITGRFGQTYAGATTPHNGLDIGAPEGTPILCVWDGVVAFADYDEGGYGNYIRVWHPAQRVYTFYGHMRDPALWASWQTVKAGQTLGFVGSTGNSTGPHCHFETRTGDEDSYADTTFGYTKGRSNPESILWAHGVDPHTVTLRAKIQGAQA